MVGKTTQCSLGLDDFVVGAPKSEPEGKRWKRQKKHLLGALDEVIINAPALETLTEEQREALNKRILMSDLPSLPSPPGSWPGRCSESEREAQGEQERKYREELRGVLVARCKAAFPLQDALIKGRREKVPHIIIRVPDGGSFHIPNIKERLESVRERVLKRFPSTKDRTVSGGNGNGKPKTGSNQFLGVLTEEPSEAKGRSLPIKLGKWTVENALRAAKDWASTDQTRHALTFLYSDGKALVATDGHALIAIPGDFGGTKKKPFWFVPMTGVRKDLEGHVFPDYTQVIPKETVPIFKGLDTKELYFKIKLAIQMTTDIFNSVHIHLNLDGSLGVKAITPEVGEYLNNIQDGSWHVTTLDPSFMLRAIRSARIMGVARLDMHMHIPMVKSHNVLVFETKSITGKGKITMVIMSKRM